MFWVVSYDIVDDRRRLRLAKLLSDYGHRVQKSVFECDLDDRRFLALKNQVERLIDHEEDSVRYYALCSRCRRAVEVSGWGTVREEEEVIIV
jgi:CRISPR-associated protein Cas2